jgi:hypothetical protein
VSHPAWSWWTGPKRYEIGVGFVDMSPEDKSNLKTFIESIARG